MIILQAKGFDNFFSCLQVWYRYVVDVKNSSKGCTLYTSYANQLLFEHEISLTRLQASGTLTRRRLVSALVNKAAQKWIYDVPQK